MAEKEETKETKTEKASKPKAAKSEAAEGETAKSEAATPESGKDQKSDDSPSQGRTASRGDRRGGRDRPRGRGGGGRRYYRRKKVDYFSVNKIDDINYKDVDTLKQFIGDRGKILPRRHTGLSAVHQRKLKIAIKRARNIALLPFAGETDGLTSPTKKSES